MLRRLQAYSGTVALVTMALTPLGGRGGAWRRRLAPCVVGSLALSTASGAARRWGAVRTGGALAAVAGGTLAAEVAGVRAGAVFGGYRYTRSLQPQVAGVPVVVPVAWVAMALPAREVAHAALGRRSTPATRVLVGAGALAAWDLFLDPQMVAEGYWRWHRPGRYRGIPLRNFVGWLAVALVIMSVLEVALPTGGATDPGQVATYGTVAGMETVAFATFLRDPLVAIVGGLGTLPVTAVAIARLVGHRP